MQNPHTLRNREIRLKAETLPASNLIVSLDNSEEFTKAGQFFTADAHDTARGMVCKTHRLATEEESKSYWDREAQTRERILQDERNRRANMNINVNVPVPAPAEPPLIERAAKKIKES